MNIRPLLAALLALPLIAMPAGAAWWGPVQGNDAGGIIPWSPRSPPTTG